VAYLIGRVYFVVYLYENYLYMLGAIGLDLGLAGPSRRLRWATPGVLRALLMSRRVSAWLPN
jgi:hypothetical protein